MVTVAQRFKMVVTIGKDLDTRQSIAYYTHALNQEDADRRLKKFVDTNPDLKGKYVYKCKAVQI